MLDCGGVRLERFTVSVFLVFSCVGCMRGRADRKL